MLAQEFEVSLCAHRIVLLDVAEANQEAKLNPEISKFSNNTIDWQL